jgi:hypothetical protein
VVNFRVTCEIELSESLLRVKLRELGAEFAYLGTNAGFEKWRWRCYGRGHGWWQRW